jgi:outer membrane murein-binding lipoprotein Lpp
MKQWEIDKINKLYSENDALRTEIIQLKHNADVNEYKATLEHIKIAIDQLNAKIDQLDSKPVKKK